LRSARGRLAKVKEGDAFPAILFGVEGRNSHMIESKKKVGRHRFKTDSGK